MTVQGGGAAFARAATRRAASDRLPHLELLATALLTMIWVELVRLWFPSVAAEMVRSATDPATRSLLLTVLLGVTATLLAAAPLAPVAGRRRFAVAAAVLLGVRATLVVEVPGGRVQLVLAAAGVMAGIVALVALASAASRPGRVRLGIGAGVLGSVLVHTATATRGLIWGASGWLRVLSLLLVVTAGVSAVQLLRDRLIAESDPEASAPGRVTTDWTWWTATPLLVLVLAVSAVPGRTIVATGWSPSTAAMTVAGIHLAAAIVAGVRPRLPRGPVLALVALGLPVAVLAASDGDGWSVVLGQAGVAVGVALLIGVPEPDRRDRTTRLTGLLPGAALALALTAMDLYHLADERTLALTNVHVHALVGLFGSALAVGLIRTRPVSVARPRLDVPRLLAVTATAVVIAVAVGVLVPRPVADADEALPGEQLRVGLVDVSAGFDPQGRYVARAQGRFLAEQELDAVILTEVDRGRLVAGGHDGLQVLAAELGFPTIVFAPTADQVAGIALLTRLDVTEIARETLPAGSDPQRRGSLAAVVSWPDDMPLGLISAQLSDGVDQGDTRLPQARAVAGTVALLRERQVATVVLADLAAGAASPELGTFTTLLHDALPEGTRTVPADDPTRRDEHVLLSPELRRTGLGLPRVPWSDRLPVIVTLERVEPAD